ncbi:MAG TPA: hypothetical protein ENI28_08005 [Roseobacter sp.]|nr:hypothetical protein [Roseobacter sp.]
MAELLTSWWVWVSAALVLGLIEVLVPGNIFLGFALGALGMVPVVMIVPGINGPLAFALFASLSLVAWIILRVFFRQQSSGTRIVSRDINED